MWQQIKRWLLPVTASLALWACAAPAAGPAETEAAGAAPKETIVFSDLNWTSAQIQTRIAQYVVEFGYGYPTEQVFGNTLPLFQALRRGDTHVTMENWLPNLQEPWNEAVEGGEVVPLGQSLGRDWQSAFVIPAYLQAQYPDLDHVEDLKDERFTQLFATAETHGKARLLTCVIGWACEVVNAEQVAGYGLADYVEIVAPGDAAAMNADLYGAYERQEPWLGFQWGTNDPTILLDLVRLEEPPYTDECWAANKACAYHDASVEIGVHPSLLDRAPDVVAMLKNWDLNISLYEDTAAWMLTTEDATLNDAALLWLGNHVAAWSNWVTPEAATGIQAALDAGALPQGWVIE